MSDDSDYHFSGDECDDNKHDEIVENVLKLNKPHNLKKPSRTEPALQISEFNLVKSVTGNKGSIQIDDLTKVLKSRKNHLKVSKKVETVNKKTRTLPKPLEKPQQDRIKRSVGYEKTRFLFDRWEAFVTSNRAQAHQVFPIGKVEKLKDKAQEAVSFVKSWTYKTPLEKALEEVEPKVEEYHMEDEAEKNELPLTLEELKEQRKEAAKLRAHQSYKEAKARRQNKIKSKKYHRILRKERIKQKLKEFEELQKTDPEAALKKLDEIEKSRALERFSLRHKSTGQWAKSKQVRAKYDKESRQVLAEQLKISRELTQKQKVTSDSEDEGFVVEVPDSNPVTSAENPWTGGLQPEKDVDEFVTGYKKFWTQQNEKAKSVPEDDLPQDKPESTDLLNDNNLEDNQNENEVEEVLISNDSEKNSEVEKTTKLQKRSKKTKKPSPDSAKKKLKKAKKVKLDDETNEWDIEELFTNAEKKIMKKANSDLAKEPRKKKVKSAVLSKKNNAKTKKDKKIDLTIPSQKKKAIVDEPMSEEAFNSESTESDPSNTVNTLKTILKEIPTNAANAKTTGISPDNFQMPKVVNLDSAQPDLMLEDENSEETNQAGVIMEALEDDDIAADFAKEKENEREQDKPQDIDLNLPGWGSWAGTGIDPKKQRKRKRFIVKMPEVLPRRDDNKGSLIINEKAAVKIKTHLVSEVPFPFKTVKDYEASIRAPIGRSFVPELAYRRYIKPAVSTKIGAIIEPATTSQLMGIPKAK